MLEVIFEKLSLLVVILGVAIIAIYVVQWYGIAIVIASLIATYVEEHYYDQDHKISWAAMGA